ncbi:PPE family protein [Mycobacterium sp.]|uniref:PPE family protein n=1 Tax=Mycobacterium sp. TaxID=1785 RepID=UPI00127136BA|nr:PPE family protein [Mycobacterium sp.]KAA8960174.1 MAG: PPE family protein [Mycobacterium sp.]
MDYGMLPPEINSGRIYAGAGSESMSQAAAAWDILAAELRSAADSYASVLSSLSAEWLGPSAARMAAAARPYTAWLRDTAARAEQAAVQARMAVRAYQAAVAATVPPAVIAANRSELAALIATNTFGHNAQAITAVEAQYAQMWAQDAAAMYNYAASSAAATRLAPFTPAPPTTNRGGAATPAVSAAQEIGASAGGVQPVLAQLADLMSTTPSILNNAATSAQTFSPTMTSLLDLLSSSSPLSIAADLLDTSLRGVLVGAAGLVNTMFGMNLDILWMQGAISSVGLSAASGPQFGASMTALDADLAAAAPVVSAQLGSAALAGGLSVPPSWAAATPTVKLVASGLHGTGTAAAPVVAAKTIEGLAGQMTLASAVGGALGKAIPPAVNVTTMRRSETSRGKDGSKPSKFERVLAELSQKPESVQHWHTDKAHLESLLEQLSKKPGTHAVHIHTGDKKRP